MLKPETRHTRIDSDFPKFCNYFVYPQGAFRVIAVTFDQKGKWLGTTLEPLTDKQWEQIQMDGYNHV